MKVHTSGYLSLWLQGPPRPYNPPYLDQHVLMLKEPKGPLVLCQLWVGPTSDKLFRIEEDASAFPFLVRNP